MTAQEAIKRLQYEGPAREYHSNINEVFDMAIEALEKQIPKKPDFEGDGYWNGELVYDTWICPSNQQQLDRQHNSNCICSRIGYGFRTGWKYLYCMLDEPSIWRGGKPVAGNHVCKHWRNTK